MKAQHQTYRERLNKVLRHIEDNLYKPSSLEDLARVACFSPYHFHRIFTAIQGESVAAYIRRLLLQQAAKQLSYTRESVTDIAFEAGYSSVDAFTRAFRAQYGLSPASYRKAGGAPAQNSTSDKNDLFYHLNLEVSQVDVKIKKFPPVLVAALRYTGPYMNCGEAWNELMGHIRANNLFTANPVTYSICHDDPDTTPPEKCRMELCVALPEGFAPDSPEALKLTRDSGVYTRTIGGEGEYAAVLIKGPYNLLHSAYRSLYGEWLPQSGREPDANPGFEAYYNCPHTAKPEDLLTEIFIPLQPR